LLSVSATLTTRATAPRRPAAAPRAGTAGAGAAALAFAEATIVALHVLRPELDPGRYAISHYAAGGRYAWLATLALVAMGGGALAIASALRADGVARRAWVLVVTFGAAILLAAVFPISAKGTPPSEHIHGAAAFFAFASLTIAMLLYARAFRRDARWHALARPTRIGGIAACVMLFTSDFVPAAAEGAFERVYLGILLAWLLAAAARLARHPPTR
jgi:hypothetical membrane protein